ncbi:MAG: fatty acyl-AMP ligase [Moorea sp. SIO2B7]|nr:fatty acyl-AMP ligase [Moorena sp. SIO2B7]
MNYQEVEKQTRAIAAHLQSLNASGERVLFLYPLGLKCMSGFFWCFSAGAIAIPAYPPRPNQSFSNFVKTFAPCGFRR